MMGHKLKWVGPGVWHIDQVIYKPQVRHLPSLMKLGRQSLKPKVVKTKNEKREKKVTAESRGSSRV